VNDPFPNRRTKFFAQVLVLLGGTLAFLGIHYSMWLPVVAGLGLMAVMMVIFLKPNLRQLRAPSAPVIPAVVRPNWAGLILYLLGLGTILYILFALAGVVPLGEHALGVIFVGGGLLMARLNQFFYQAELFRLERTNSRLRRLVPPVSPRVSRFKYVVIGVAAAGYGFLMFFGRV